ncbi:DNA repair protein RecN [Saliterribacillus persicus]|uniref:DNA repair protein RecN n=1 Tax=Saliterribacillus persicus TaxID=930114 RepID=A0A368XCJ4_9BACI|nr:DNA repair protein RecN [Saliterribacillus persicus]RCW65419.1 DNA replication and repair protein RecN [Saliterribacillus persicus]
MLTELSIKNFAIIDQTSISFEEGLTVLTGETGAGKSIIIDALGLLVGGRGSVEYIRHGEKKAELEGLFILDNKSHPVFNKTKEYGIEISKDNMVVLERIISLNGKNICRINGKLVTLAILKEIGQTLLDIHSQHETQALMEVDHHLELVDLFLEQKEPKCKDEYTYLYKKWLKLKKRYDNWNKNEQELAQRVDLLSFQLEELQAAELKPGEEKDLTEERNQLANFEKIYQGLYDAYHALHGEHKGLDWLSLAANGIETVSEFDQTFEEIKKDYLNHYYLIEELSYELRNKLDSTEFDETRLNEIESRLSELARLKKKYGPTEEEMIEYQAKIEEELEKIRDRDTAIIELEQELKDVQNDLILEAKDIHDKRVKIAKKIEQAITSELADLYLEKAKFEISISWKKGTDQDPFLEDKHVHLTSSGADNVRFMIATNPGEPVKELNKIASGGELSRIMLALKNIFSNHQGITSVIFDEVDTGVSGRVAQAIAEKIQKVSIGSQVLCITHLPQVASMADTHLLISKTIDQNRTYTNVDELSLTDRISEIGRMITGTDLTKTSMEHAKELINTANKWKKA